MPSPYIVRSFASNSYYHVFNRRLSKSKTFRNPQDYKIFKYYLLVYLLPLSEVLKIYPMLKPRLQANNLHGQVELIAYCLMPTHFHLLLKQNTQDAISKLMKQISNAYTKYFNEAYDRNGSLFESRFKATQIKSEEVLIHISRYIHLNPMVANLVDDIRAYPWSSFEEYRNNEQGICHKELVLSRFRSTEDYVKFVNDQVDYGKQLEKLKHLTIDA